MKLTLVTGTFLLLITGKLFAQGNSGNLLANPGFEDINTCTEYNAPCAPEAWFNVPATNFLIGRGSAVTPKAGHMLLLLPVGSVLPSAKNQRFTYTMLCCPMVKDEEYEIGFYINTGRKPFRGLDMYLATKEPDIFSMNKLDKNKAIIITEKDIDGGDVQWQHIRKTMKAAGGEMYLILGNNPPIPYTYSMKDAMNQSGDVFYFLDEMVLRSVSGIPLCTDYVTNVKRIYAQNLRHSEAKVPAAETVIVKKPPVFTRDTITIPSVLFDVNSAALKPAVKRILDSVISVIAVQKVARLEINGHADNTGTLALNEKLAADRATVVKDYMAGKLPQMAGSMSAAGKGISEPVADNNTAGGRSKNRRVEVIISRVRISE
jgi:outer membrane protein OmpA-like peptidoglycan-associated protein